MTGELSLEQINLVFSHLPVDLTFVDETLSRANDACSGGIGIRPRDPARPDTRTPTLA
jgi:hypothetical protein